MFPASVYYKLVHGHVSDIPVINVKRRVNSVYIKWTNTVAALYNLASKAINIGTI